MVERSVQGAHGPERGALPRGDLVPLQPDAPPLPRHPAAGDDLAAQLDALYDDRLKLHRALGVSSADDVIMLVRSMQQQLEDLYDERAGG